MSATTADGGRLRDRASEMKEQVERNAEVAATSPTAIRAQAKKREAKRHFLRAGHNLANANGRAAIANLVRGFGAAAITLALIVVVLNQVFTLDVVNNSSGPFAVGTIQDPVSGALALFGIALLVVGAAAAIRQMGGGGGGGM